MIPNPVSPSQNIAKIQQPAEVAEEEPLYVNAKQVRIPGLFLNYLHLKFLQQNWS